MPTNSAKTWLDSSYLAESNQSYIDSLYEDFLINPNSIDESWKKIFQQLSYSTRTSVSADIIHAREINQSINKCNENYKQEQVMHLVNAFRCRGHQHANLDPLGLWKQETVPDLNPAFYKLTEADFHTKFNVGSFVIDGSELMKLKDLYDVLKKTYCGSIGFEYMHISNIEEKRWIQDRIESLMMKSINLSSEEKKRLLKELTAAEGIERYLSTKFPGAKRFSLEGGDVLIPMLKEMIRHACGNGTREIILGMAHRGRLNVLINVLGKRFQDLCNEFIGKHNNQNIKTTCGDVKYHQGYSSHMEIDGRMVHVTLAFNPSHLEIISPVVMGLVRARLDLVHKKQHLLVLPVIIHGDAAICGQGVVQETFNMSKTRGYDVGGSIHIMINNQIGFTTSNHQDARSTRYCTDIGKMVEIPIFHVNADDPEAVMFLTRLALDFRNTFKRDVMIDLVCYRRYGHNEADEPSATQPMMYKKIQKHQPIRQIYAISLEQDGITTMAEANDMVHLYRKTLDQGTCVVNDFYIQKANTPDDDIDEDAASFSTIEIKNLQKLADDISEIPTDVVMHPLVSKIYHDRAGMARGVKPFDWGGAENLAYATLVDHGISIRLSGEDTARGTFFHRHAVIHNQKNGSTYTPLANMRTNNRNKGTFHVWDTVLSEEAVLAFEYGYATSQSRTLVIWEAQFGDFANGAQVVIDQFISSGEHKWGQRCRLVMLLPHGYEGQGPEHSSARLERYLQLCADNNIQVCIPSTPAQIYHLLRRQALGNIHCPLVVMSPKSLLRHPMVISSLEELANGTFLPVIGELDHINPKNVKRVVMCSGKVYYDLLNQRRKNGQRDVAIIRIEQLYPFPLQAVQEVLTPYLHLQDLVWCQEEPKNQGAWYCSQHFFNQVILPGATLHYVGRPASASTAVGYFYMHNTEQKKLVNDALNLN